MTPDQNASTTPNQDTSAAPKEDPQADGYYGDDDMSSEELDLSFLDEDTSTSKK